MSASTLDTTLNIATPEGVELKLPVAGFAPRSLAWLLDALIKYTALTIVAVFAGLLGGFGIGIQLIAAFFLLWIYNVAFEVFNNGATPGKKVLGLRVMNTDGTPVSWSGSVIRNLIRFVDVLPGAYLFGLTSILLTRNMQRLGDLAAETVVVFQPRTPAHGGVWTVKPLALTVPMSPDEQKALVSFGERADQLHADRASELAAIVSPLINDASAKTLCRHAAWIVGRSAD